MYLKGTLVNAEDSTPEAVQITDEKFIDTKYLVLEDFINHSCSPNTTLDMVKRWFIAVRDISKNKEMTFNYLTTEWDMKKWGVDFQCICGSKNCFGRIKGFKYLTREQKLKLKPLLSPLLLKKLIYSRDRYKPLSFPRKRESMLSSQIKVPRGKPRGIIGTRSAHTLRGKPRGIKPLLRRRSDEV